MKSKKRYKNIPEHNNGQRLKVAFFDYPDVFEDFYPHYGVDQKKFATTWHNTGNHAWVKIVQEEIGDVIWYALSLKPQLKEAIHEYAGCRVKFLPSSWFHRKIWRLFYQSTNGWKGYRVYRRYATIASYTALLSWPLIKELWRDKPDVIFAQEYCSGRFDVLLFYAGLLKIPLVTFHTGSTSDKYLGKGIKAFSIPRANFVFPSGNNEMKMLTKKYRVPESKQLIIRPPIDLNIYKPINRTEACQAFHLDPEKRYFIFMGRLEDSVKRLSTVIDLFADLAKQYPQFDLLIVGNGKDEQSLKQQANDLIPGRIHFLGWIGEDKEKALALNASDCLLLASSREGLPTVIGEAFACGVPVISSNVGAIDDLVIHGEMGWLFPAGDDPGLRKCMEEVMKDPGKVVSMRKKVRAVAEEKVSVEAMTKALCKGFSSIPIRVTGFRDSHACGV